MERKGCTRWRLKGDEMGKEKGLRRRNTAGFGLNIEIVELSGDLCGAGSRQLCLP